MMETNIISFPNIGIDNLKIDRIAFTVFGRGIYWYGLLITIAILTAYFISSYNAKREHISNDDVLDFTIWVVLAGIVGARAYYVLTSLDEFPTLWDALKVWNGGLAFYGCVIGGAIAAFIVAKIKKLKFSVIFDMVAPTLLLAQAIGRWGNFFNAEAFGSVTEWDFFGQVFSISGAEKLPWIMTINGTYVMPTFLYEFFFNVIGFTVLMLIYKKKQFNGQIFLEYIIWYGCVRTIVEGFRTDSLYIGSIRISQLVGALCVIVGALLLVVFSNMAAKGKLPKPFDFSEEELKETDIVVIEEPLSKQEEIKNEEETNEKEEKDGENN